MSEVPEPVKRFAPRGLPKAKKLEDFAKTVEIKLMRAVQDRDAMANLVCRMLISNDLKVAAPMLCKWVEWRYGKAKEQIDHNVTIDRIISVEDAKRMAQEILAERTDSKTITVEPDGSGSTGSVGDVGSSDRL